jgi:hypothetical protein
MATALLASNQSAVFIRRQSALGTFANPTTVAEDGTGGNVGTYAIRAIGAPKFAVRGAGIIDRKEVFTPWAGNTSSRTGGLGWDITLQTEFFWRFNQPFDLDLSNQTQLAALWLSSPWAISSVAVTNDTLLAVQPFFEPAVTRGTTAYAVQPFSMVVSASTKLRNCEPASDNLPTNNVSAAKSRHKPRRNVSIWRGS